MDISLFDILNFLSTPLAGAVGWFIGRRKQKNDFLAELQASIDLLATKNRELMEEVVALRRENAKMQIEIEELNRKLENVKTITKKA